MSPVELEALLKRIGDGVAEDEDIERARDLLETLQDDGFGDQLEAAIHTEAGGEWFDVELEDGWTPVRDEIAAGVVGEAGMIDVADAVLDQLEAGEAKLPIAEAVRAQAGDVDVSADVLAALETEAALFPIAEAVQAGAGTVDVADAVLARLGAEAAMPPIAEAIRAEAGEIDVVNAVLETIQRASEVSTYETPAPANTSRASGAWGRGLIALAAAALIAVVGATTMLQDSAQFEPVDLQFASMDEIVVDELDYGDDVNVQIFTSGQENGPLIIWIDEGVTS